MQKIALVGNLGRDAKVFETSTGKKCVWFTVAVNGYRNGEIKTSWYTVSWFNYLPSIVPYLKKGKSVVVTGDLDADLKYDKNGSVLIDRNVLADSVNFLNVGSGSDDRQNYNSTKKQQVSKAVEAKEEAANVSDDEITTITKPKETKKAAVVKNDVEETSQVKEDVVFSDETTDELPF